MSPHEIRTELFRQKVTHKAIANEAGTSTATVSLVISGRMKTPVVRRTIARLIKHSYAAVWGTKDPGVDHLKPGPQSASHQ